MKTLEERNWLSAVDYESFDGHALVESNFPVDSNTQYNQEFNDWISILESNTA